jgi:hypothetical protein
MENTASSTPLASQVDHLVVVAATLEQGVQWCERVLGITPGPGGEHALMGTHNRLFSVASPAFPRAYFEIIAINPAKPSPRVSPARRWFDLDDKELQLHLANTGPQLAHFVASTDRVSAAVRAFPAWGWTAAKCWKPRA